MHSLAAREMMKGLCLWDTAAVTGNAGCLQSVSNSGRAALKAIARYG